MIEIGTLMSTVVAGYDWLRVWHERQANPPHLPLHALLVFKAFKAAYDAKDVARLAPIIADDYQGDVFGVRTKEELLWVQAGVHRDALGAAAVPVRECVQHFARRADEVSRHHRYTVSRYGTRHSDV